MSNARPRILVVDDDRPIRDVISTVLKEAGYDILQAIHGGEAIALVDDAPPDLIISDLMMPIVDGIELCRYAKARGDIAVILMSSAPPTVVDADHDAFLPKPFALDTLESLVAGVLARHDDPTTGPAPQPT
ncbi:MAG TPA: response regulator [Thermomicrobiales bacterium]|nr:response regulator [Thermomicrobiales bacterium]